MAIAKATDGRVVVGGRSYYWDAGAGATNEMFALVRYTALGALDSTFGNNGKVVYNAGSATYPAKNVESIRGLAIDSSNRIVAAGTYSSQTVSQRFALLRFTSTGHLDTSFGPTFSGMTTGFGGCSWAGCFEEASGDALALQTDGKIVVAGNVRLLNSGSWDTNVALARFMPDGSRDSAGFGTDGYVRTDLGGWAGAKAVQPAGGSLFVTGYVSGGDQAMVARYSISNGALDTNFNGGVVVGTSCPPQQMSPALALAIQRFSRGFVPTHKPVIVGTCISY
jgi:uncharacterized delta-60 repeat protein